MAPASGESKQTIEKSDVQVYIDCTNMTEGNHTLEVKFVENENLIIVSDATVKVSLTEKKSSEKVESTKEPENTPVVTIAPEETSAAEEEDKTEPEEDNKQVEEE